MSINRTVENVYLRQDAVQLTRKHFWPLVGMSIVANIIINVLDQALTEIGDLLMIPEVNQLTEQFNYLNQSGKLTSTEPVLQSAIALFTSPKFIIFNLIYMLITGLVSAGINLGRTREMIDAVRGNGVRVRGVFGLMRYCLKGLLLNIWTGFKALLWLLPGVGVMLAGGFMMSTDLVEIGNFVTIVGFGIFFGLWISALLRYSLALPLLADEPDRSIRDCVKHSCTLMKGRKWQYIKLQVPVWLKILGVIFASALACSLLETLLPLSYSAYSLLSTVLMAAATIYFFFQLDMVCMAFYEKMRWPNPEDKPAKPVSYWLQEHTATNIEEESTDEAEESPQSPAEAIEASPADIPPETNEEKENNR